MQTSNTTAKCYRLKRTFFLWNLTLTLSSAPSPRPFHHPQPWSALHCGKVSLEALARRYGTPLYVYSADQIVERLSLFQQAFAGRDHLVCYAVKANSALAILKLLAERGAGFDIVSGGELERVLAAAPEAVGRVVFSGVGKTAAEIDLALTAGILEFNVESEAELELLAARARKLKRKARFALRVNPDVFAETHPYISTGLREHKFGIDIRQAARIYKSAAGNRWLEAHGVSVHIGSQIRSAEPVWRGDGAGEQAGAATAARQALCSRRSMPAGGWASTTTAAVLMRQPKCASTPRPLNRRLGGFEGRLLLEPGRFLVAQAGALVARVLHVKRNGKKTFVITDAAMNDLIRPALYQAHHEIVPVRPRAGKARVGGCGGTGVRDAAIFLRATASSSLSKPGDLVALLDAGAYGMAQSSNYNTRLRPAEVLVEGAKARLIRRRETMADLLAPEMAIAD